MSITEHRPVARCVLDLSPAHLDHPFDYAVPQELDELATPGVRVKVRFAGQLTNGYLIERLDHSDHPGTLHPLTRVISPHQLLTPEIHALTREVATYYAGTLSDVLRSAIPPRHARAEKTPHPPLTTPPPAPDISTWAPYRGGEAFLHHLTLGHHPTAVWTALPGVNGGHLHAAHAIAAACAATSLSHRSSLVVVPDHRDITHVVSALSHAGMPPWRDGGPVATLTSDLDPQTRYENYLAILAGRATIVVGTRAAAYAPITQPGLYICWDDSADTHTELRAPYPHTREILALRTKTQAAAYLIGSFSRTLETQYLVDSAWAPELVAARDTTRATAPRVRVITSLDTAAQGPAGTARIPSPAWTATRTALTHGPVLIQVPRAGYIPVTACARCRNSAHCPDCHGPLSLTGPHSTPQCGWCARLVGTWSCPECHHQHLRSIRVGSKRTAEELGRGFPGTRIHQSSAATGILDTIDNTPSIVVATPGAEPIPHGGYSAAVILDAAATIARPGLTTTHTAISRWFAAAGLVRPHAPVMIIGDLPTALSNALTRWDPATYTTRELAERTELSLPPAVRMVTLTGHRTAIESMTQRIPSEHATFLGPVERDDGQHRLIIRVPRRHGRELARHLAASLAIRSAHREPGNITIHFDPQDIV